MISVAMCRKLLTAAEIGEVLRLKPARIYELVRSGTLPCVHLGRQIRFDPIRIQEWIDSGGQALSAGWRHDRESQIAEILERGRK